MFLGQRKRGGNQERVRDLRLRPGFSNRRIGAFPAELRENELLR